MNERLIEAIRAKYNYEMKESVSMVELELETPSKEAIERIDGCVENFVKAKEKLSYFEAIIKNLKGEE